MSLSFQLLSFVATVVIVKATLQKDASTTVKSSEFDDSSVSLDILPSPTLSLQLLRSRRSIYPKQFTGKSVPRLVIDDMLEAARWAPTHKITEPWRFFVFESQEGREYVGRLLQEVYKNSCAPIGDNGTSKKRAFLQAKYDKIWNSASLSSHIIAICVLKDTKNPFVEDVCSVAMAVQNMHLMATAHGVGAYWSSGGVHSTEEEDGSSLMGVVNPRETSQFLKRENEEPVICLGWMYVGDFYGSLELQKVWPTGRRGSIEDKTIWI